MVFRTTGAGWLALMMRAERTRSGLDPIESLDGAWLLRGPTDADPAGDDEAPMLLAAE